MRAGCIADLKAALEYAMARATIKDNEAVIVSAVRTGIELVKADLEQTMLDLKATVEEYIARREMPQ